MKWKSSLALNCYKRVIVDYISSFRKTHRRDGIGKEKRKLIAKLYGTPCDINNA